MSSFVYFKFKSQKEPQRVTIDGPHTDVWNLKREIINIARLGDGTDFDLKIYKENSDEEYTDDTEIIPKDSTVLARRLPAAAPGKGRAARYVSGKPPVSAKTTSSAARKIEINENMTEEERMRAMFQMTDAQWQQKQGDMSHEQKVAFGGKPFQKKANVPEGEPPHGYICYRCGKKGHWIQACPTNDDANYDNRNRIKRTTGIPRSMLKKIDQSEIDNLDETQRQNLMVNAEGEYVFAQADEKTWRKHQEQAKAAELAQKNGQDGNAELKDRGLECSIDKRMFVDPMKTPCCGKTYCHDCIENALLENDLTCPGCETENVSLERLEPDEDMKVRIKEYQSEKAGAARSPASAAATPAAESVNDRAESKSPTSTTSQSKKRSADEAAGDLLLQPPAMKRQKSATSQTAETKTESASPHENQDSSNPNNTASAFANMPPNMMPPDMFSMMQNMPNMGTMPTMPNMPFNPMAMGLMPGMMNMNGMAGMTGINGMNGMSGMSGMNGMNMNMNMPMMPNMMPFNMMPNGNNMFPQQQSQSYNNYNNNNNHQNRPQKQFYNRPAARPITPQPIPQPNGMSGVPTGPKAMVQPPATNGGATGAAIPPTGPKFANQQRSHTGKEEDNAYIRQPVNPHRHKGRGRGGGMRVAEYREL